MIVIVVAVFAHDDETADTAPGQQRFVNSEVGEIFFHSEPLGGIEGYARLDGVERHGWIARVVGKGVRRKAGWKMIAHIPTVADDRGDAPLGEFALCVILLPVDALAVTALA
ncbi:hypothetical protein GOEFS_094_00160 [Gordonia effusa NBRC 100432]|uniref:Uncharacterized protein n=1 Tax=Gordonia effusa NBRC 100432 TaxID=1077974 RepID=H0R3R6_9ACTN|nr:hypothetical protein GOEFS_094_00160 [Gordonia effusa NBRC 100432]